MMSISLASLLSSGLTGRRVKVAMVDSGINSRHPHIRGIAGGVGIRIADGGEILFDGEIDDEIGHGTAGAAVVRKKAPDAELFSIKVFRHSLSTYAHVLAEAIEWSIRNGMDAVNLSLGTDCERHAELLRAVCRRAARQGLVIVAAAPSDARVCYPASFREVIGVTDLPGCPEDVMFYRRNAPVQVLACGHPRPLPGVPVDRNFHGPSLACAHVCGVVALLKEQAPQSGVESVIRLMRGLRTTTGEPAFNPDSHQLNESASPES